mmetsp:Transcript_29349/g.89888  ORF Transcript_29349/g.89888 Transcript_29349/m.89888 type:complete len:269 (-) Transcript_29349:209-1015(-)
MATAATRAASNNPSQRFSMSAPQLMSTSRASDESLAAAAWQGVRSRSSHGSGGAPLTSIASAASAAFAQPAICKGGTPNWPRTSGDAPAESSMDVNLGMLREQAACRAVTPFASGALVSAPPSKSSWRQVGSSSPARMDKWSGSTPASPAATLSSAPALISDRTRSASCSSTAWCRRQRPFSSGAARAWSRASRSRRSLMSSGRASLSSSSDSSWHLSCGASASNWRSSTWSRRRCGSGRRSGGPSALAQSPGHSRQPSAAASSAWRQ